MRLADLAKVNSVIISVVRRLVDGQDLYASIKNRNSPNCVVDINFLRIAKATNFGQEQMDLFKNDGL